MAGVSVFVASSVTSLSATLSTKVSSIQDADKKELITI